MPQDPPWSFLCSHRAPSKAPHSQCPSVPAHREPPACDGGGSSDPAGSSDHRPLLLSPSPSDAHSMSWPLCTPPQIQGSPGWSGSIPAGTGRRCHPSSPALPGHRGHRHPEQGTRSCSSSLLPSLSWHSRAPQLWRRAGTCPQALLTPHPPGDVAPVPSQLAAPQCGGGCPRWGQGAEPRGAQQGTGRAQPGLRLLPTPLHFP